MRAFSCDVCGARLFFEKSVCITCGSAVGFCREDGRMVAVQAPRRICVNLNVNGCNWLAAPTSVHGYCFSCSLTRTRPADSDASGMANYYVAEFAKRRLVFELDQLGLPIQRHNGTSGLAFDLLSSVQKPVTTGHRHGIITFDLAESNDVHREGLRIGMDEPYRTVLGHFRHEIGHYYWDLLVGPSSGSSESGSSESGTSERLAAVRELFGDETASYSAALSRHYDSGPPPDWRSTFISAYASMHPWEDFAEVFAHVLHIRDTLQTAAEFDLGVPSAFDDRPFTEIVRKVWLPLTLGLNQINRSMGKGDLYPFVLQAAVITKLGWVADLIAAGRNVT